MVDVVLRYLDYDVMRAQLDGLGITVHSDILAQLTVEQAFGAVNTPVLEACTGKVFTIRMTDLDAESLSVYLDPPNFVCDWRSDEGNETDGMFTPFAAQVYDCDELNHMFEPVVVQRLVGTIA